jgi:hypothetical protein
MLLQFCRLWPTLTSYLIILSFLSIHGSSSTCSCSLSSPDVQLLIGIIALRVNAIYGGERWVRRVLCIAGILYTLSTLAITTVEGISVWGLSFDIRFLFVSLNIGSPVHVALVEGLCTAKVCGLRPVDNILFPTSSRSQCICGPCGYRRSYSIFQHFGEDSLPSFRIIFEALLFILTMNNAIRRAKLKPGYNALHILLYCDGE